MRTLVGLDLGTTTVTGVLLDAERGQVLCRARRRNDASLLSTLPTRAEQDPYRLRALALEVLAELATGGHRIDGGHRADGIALTGQKHGLLCVDADGHPLTTLVSWQDQRTAEPWPGGPGALDQIHARTADLSWHENGCRLAHGYGAATLFWLVRRGELPPATRRVCSLAGWLAGQLAGRLSPTDPTFAASWGVYSLLDGAWNDAFLDRLGLEAELFPEVRPSGEHMGGLVPEVARQVGLPDGTPVFNPLGDTQAAFLGAFPPAEEAGLDVRSSEGQGSPSLGQPGRDRTILVNLGTGGQICWLVPDFEPPTEAVEIRPLLPGCFLRVGASLCGGAAYAWLNQTVRAWLADLGFDVDEETVYQRLNALAAVCDDTEGIRVRTTFLGVRGDPAVQGGTIEGITLENLRLGPLARATSAGIVDELYGLYQAHAGDRTRYRQVIATGGSVERNPVLPGLIEGRFGLPVHVSRQPEPAAVGAALLVTQWATG